MNATFCGLAEGGNDSRGGQAIDAGVDGSALAVMRMRGEVELSLLVAVS